MEETCIFDWKALGFLKHFNNVFFYFPIKHHSPSPPQNKQRVYPWKLLRRRSFPFVTRPIFRCKLLVSRRVVIATSLCYQGIEEPKQSMYGTVYYRYIDLITFTKKIQPNVGIYIYIHIWLIFMDLMGYTYPYNLNSDHPETLPPPPPPPQPPSRCQATRPTTWVHKNSSPRKLIWSWCQVQRNFLPNHRGPGGHGNSKGGLQCHGAPWFVNLGPLVRKLMKGRWWLINTMGTHNLHF